MSSAAIWEVDVLDLSFFELTNMMQTHKIPSLCLGPSFNRGGVVYVSFDESTVQVLLMSKHIVMMLYIEI